MNLVCIFMNFNENSSKELKKWKNEGDVLTKSLISKLLCVVEN